jgi:transcriptional regulator with XRE-family HTH domain
MLRLPALGHAIRHARIARDLTQDSLAQATGVSRLTINQLENGVAPDLGIKKVNVILDMLGLELEVRPVQTPQKTTDFLFMASISASVSLKEPLLTDELEHALLSGKVPPGKEAHLITLLEEAPQWMLEGLAQQVGAWTKPGKIQSNLCKLAQTLGLRPEIGKWMKVV